MGWLRNLWEKWWFYIPISFILTALIIGVLGFSINVTPRNVATLTWLVWIGFILNRFVWSRKKKK